MHELSIAVNIAEIVEEEMQKHDASQLNEIVIEIGKMSGVVAELLEFALKESFDNHAVSKANIVFNHIEGKAECLQCHTLQTVENLYNPCINCGSFNLSIIEGKELKIKSLLIE